MLERWRVWVCARLLSHTRRKGLCSMLPVMCVPRSLADLLIRTIRFPAGSGEARLQTGISWKVGLLPQRLHPENKRILRIIRLIFSFSRVHVRRKFIWHWVYFSLTLVTGLFESNWVKGLNSGKHFKFKCAEIHFQSYLKSTWTRGPEHWFTWGGEETGFVRWFIHSRSQGFGFESHSGFLPQ